MATSPADIANYVLTMYSIKCMHASVSICFCLYDVVKFVSGSPYNVFISMALNLYFLVQQTLASIAILYVI